MLTCSNINTQTANDDDHWLLFLYASQQTHRARQTTPRDSFSSLWYLCRSKQWMKCRTHEHNFFSSALPLSPYSPAERGAQQNGKTTIALLKKCKEMNNYFERFFHRFYASGIKMMNNLRFLIIRFIQINRVGLVKKFKSSQHPTRGSEFYWRNSTR